MATVWDNLKIVDFQLNARDSAWLVGKYGSNVTYSCPAPIQAFLTTVWESSGPMTIIVTAIDGPSGKPLEGVEVHFGWPDGDVETRTGPDGRADFAMGAGGHYNPKTQTGPHFCYMLDRDGKEVFRATGLGWVDLSNHDHINVVVELGAHVPPPPPPPPPTGTPDIRGYLDTALAALSAARALLP